jgi:Universal stress protein family
MVEKARDVAKEGADLARTAGFDAEPLAERGSPVWARIVEVADENDAAVVVIGSHGRSGVRYAVMGSVATAVAQHSKRPGADHPDGVRLTAAACDLAIPQPPAAEPASDMRPPRDARVR